MRWPRLGGLRLIIHVHNVDTGIYQEPQTIVLRTGDDMQMFDNAPHCFATFRLREDNTLEIEFKANEPKIFDKKMPSFVPAATHLLQLGKK